MTSQCANHITNKEYFSIGRRVAYIQKDTISYLHTYAHKDTVKLDALTIYSQALAENLFYKYFTLP